MQAARNCIVLRWFYFVVIRMKLLHKITGGIAIAALAIGASSVLLANDNELGEIIQNALDESYSASSGSILTTGRTLINDEEFSAALAWMYETHITKYDTQEAYGPFDLLTREQAAKMLGQFFTTYVENPDRLPMSSCQFGDIETADPTLKPYILDVCQFSIFKGSKGSFLPLKVITKAELTATLIRMFSDGKLDETPNPRWLNYFTKAQQLGMTKETNKTLFENPVSRYELALLLYRFKKIYNDEVVAAPIAPVSGNIVVAVSGAAALNNTGLSESLLSLVTAGTNITDNPEFKETVFWMYDNGLTKFQKAADFLPFEALTREQAAKMLVQYRKLMFPGKAVTTTNECTFKDLGTADASLKDWIIESCQLNILKGGDGYFLPTKPLSKPEAIAVLLRMFDLPQDETSSPRRKNYFTKANELGLINESSQANFDKPITRYEMSTLMYRLRVKNILVQSLNSNTIKNQLITMVTNSNQLITSSGGRARGYILINTYLLGDAGNDYFIIDLFGSKYKIMKNTVHKYYNNQYVRYGDVFTLDGATNVGIANFIVNDTIVLEGMIRPYGDGKPSYILGPTATPPYYLIKETVPVQPGAPVQPPQAEEETPGTGEVTPVE